MDMVMVMVAKFQLDRGVLSRGATVNFAGLTGCFWCTACATGWLLFWRSFILILLEGSSRDISSYLRQARTVCVDVDSNGRRVSIGDLMPSAEAGCMLGTDWGG